MVSRHWTASLLVLFVLVALLLSVPAQVLAHQTPIPETAQVIAQGVERIPRRSAVWRLTRREFAPLVGIPGFILPEADPVTVTWEDGRQVQVALGEAAFLGTDAAARIAGESGEAVPFQTIELAPAGFAGVGGFDIPYVGDGFLAPPGEHTLELVRETLQPGIPSYFDPGAGQGVIYVTEGTVEVQYGRGTEVVGAGAAGPISDDAALVAVGAGPATYFAARVGAVVPSGESELATSGEVGVTLYDCPAGMRPESLTPSLCTFTTGPIVDLQIDPLGSGPAAPRTLRDASRDGEALVWDDLPFDEYAVHARSFADGYDRFLIPDLAGLNTPPELGYTASPNEGYVVNLDATTPVHDLPAFLFRSTPGNTGVVTAGQGTIAVRLHACPAHMRPLTLDTAACPLDADVANLRIGTSSGGENRRDLTDATPEGDALAWSELPFARYTLQVREFATGYDRYLIPGWMGLNIPPDLGYGASPNEGYILPLDAAHPSYLLDAYVFRAYESAGALDLDVRFWQCPADVAAAPDMRNLGCAALASAPEGFELEIAGGGLRRPLQLAQATADGGDVGWDDVPGGEYRVTARLPAGTPGYAVRNYDPGVRVHLLSDHSGYALVFLLEAGALPAPSAATLDVYLLQ